MKTLVLALSFAVVSLVAASTGAEAAPDCSYRGGFAALHAQVPGVVGDCLEDEHFDAASGNVLQRTVRGLLVWRSADNWTAFTDGATTWINGPAGVTPRPNERRFCWEPDGGCGFVPPTLHDSWDLLMYVKASSGETFQDQARRIIERYNVTLATRSLPEGIMGTYVRRDEIVYINYEVSYDVPAVGAAVLVHELAHVYQPQGMDCVEREVEAMVLEAYTWVYLVDLATPPTTIYQQEERDRGYLYHTEGVQGIRDLIESSPLYREQCGL